MQSSPHIALIHNDRFPPELFKEFSQAVAAEGLDFELHERSSGSGVFAGVQWLLPTAVMLFVSKSYFDGFLKEMGKDHYSALKGGLKKLGDLLSHVKVTVFATRGKADSRHQFSYVYSIWLEGNPGSSLKFLVPSDCEEAEADRIMDVFMDFVRAYYEGTLDEAHAEAIRNARAIGSVRLIGYDRETESIEIFDAMNDEFEHAPVPRA